MSPAATSTEAKFICQQWRAKVGRLPLAHQQTIYRLAGSHPVGHLERALVIVAEHQFRRTLDRWRLFLACFGETP